MLCFFCLFVLFSIYNSVKCYRYFLFADNPQLPIIQFHKQNNENAFDKQYIVDVVRQMENKKFTQV